jgi:hypothetical protein
MTQDVFLQLNMNERPPLGGYLSTIPETARARSAIHGHGLFSTRRRASGERLVKLDGQVFPADAASEAVLDMEWNALSDRLLLVRAIPTSYGYINHASEANLTIESDGTTISTTREIESGEELTLNYLAQPLPQKYLDATRGAYLRHD